MTITIHDDFALPAPDHWIKGRAVREDEYAVFVTAELGSTVDRLCGVIEGRRVAMVTDTTVRDLHAADLADLLRARGVAVDVMAIEPGERNKSVPTAMSLLDWLAQTSIGRRDVILPVGGGVVIDTVGWVASAYMRGVPYVNVPTTLLAHVDAALGGKVAVDHPCAKNLVGSFCQPKAVVSYVGYLTTLDRRQIRAGLAEAIKKGVIASPALFEFIEAHVDHILEGRLPELQALVRAASAIKLELIARDPYEVDLRRPLNFGHTVGHALETVTDYGPVLHGEAVAFGMVVATRISVQRRWAAPGLLERLVLLLERAGLPSTADRLPVPVDPAAVMAAMEKIRLIRDGNLCFVLPLELGRTAIADDVDDREIHEAIVCPSLTSTPS